MTFQEVKIVKKLLSRGVTWHVLDVEQCINMALWTTAAFTPMGSSPVGLVWNAFQTRPRKALRLTEDQLEAN